jgi:hypothetical protein
MRDFPDSKRAVSTGYEEHVLRLVVMYHANFLCELSLQHYYALSTFFDVSDTQRPFLSAFTVARHA